MGLITRDSEVLDDLVYRTPVKSTGFSEVVQVRYLPGSPALQKTEKGDWIDLYTYEDVNLKTGEFAIISQGVAMKLPEGYEAILAPRSSTFKRWGVLQTNSIGVIDSSYCGSDDIWGMPVYATRDVTIPKGTRICQFRIQLKQPTIQFEQVVRLNDINRGGFGSTN